ncbi:hypothetical protein HN51_047552 [Arachis hypogaea]
MDHKQSHLFISSNSDGYAWMDGVLAKGEEVKFFHNEFRPIFVKDLVNMILALTSLWISKDKQIELLLNVGRPDKEKGQARSNYG